MDSDSDSDAGPSSPVIPVKAEPAPTPARTNGHAKSSKKPVSPDSDLSEDEKPLAKKINGKGKAKIPVQQESDSEDSPSSESDPSSEDEKPLANKKAATKKVGKVKAEPVSEDDVPLAKGKAKARKSTTAAKETPVKKEKGGKDVKPTMKREKKVKQEEEDDEKVSQPLFGAYPS